MTVTTAMAAGSGSTGGFGPYSVPVIVGDSAAAHRLSSAYHDLADAVDAASAQIGAVMAALTATWRGVGSAAATAPVEKIRRDAAALSAALRTAGEAMRTYARELEKAHEHHGFSLQKLAAIGAVVAVSAVAITVTLGAAAVVEAGAATALVAGATEAAGDAVTADLAVGEGLSTALARTSFLRPLLAFVVPHLLQLEWSAGSIAGWDEATSGRLNWRAIGVAGGLSFVGAAGSEAVGSRIAATEWYDGASPVLQRTTSALGQGTLWAGVTGLDDEIVQGRLVRADLLDALVITSGGTAAHDVMKDRGIFFHEPDYRRAALIAGLHQPGRMLDSELAHEMALLRQPLEEVVRGDVDLALHEGYGHTIDRHIGRTTQQLMARIRRQRLPRASTYWDETGAQKAINEALRANRAQITEWLAHNPNHQLEIRYLSNDDVGYTVTKRGRVILTRRVVVVLKDVHGHLTVITSYPDPRP